MRNLSQRPYVFILVNSSLESLPRLFNSNFFCWQKIVDVNSKSHRQIYFLLLAHYQPTTLLKQAGNLLMETFGTLMFIMIT